MGKKNAVPGKPGRKNRAPREVEGPSAAPGPGEGLISSVGANDNVRLESGQTVEDAEVVEEVVDGMVDSVKEGSGKPASDEDPWLEPMMDIARLVLAAYEADPHRFDKSR